MVKLKKKNKLIAKKRQSELTANLPLWPERAAQVHMQGPLTLNMQLEEIELPTALQELV